jgi:hypothetical protein
VINVDFRYLAAGRLTGRVVGNRAGMMDDRMRDVGSTIIDVFVCRILPRKVNASVH